MNNKSKSYPIENIANVDRIIYLFCRDENNQRYILRDSDYFPSTYILNDNGKYKSFDGKNLDRVFFSSLKDKREYKSKDIYQSDLNYCKEYLIYKVDDIIKSKSRIISFDIENIPVKGCPVGESYLNPTGAITCITVHDNYTDTYTTWWIEEQLGRNYDEKEKNLINNFINYVNEMEACAILAHNCSYDYNYLYTRTKRIFGKKYNIAKELSPIKETRFGKFENELPIYYPCGLSILDFKGLYEKITLNKKASYALNYLAQEDLGLEDWGDTDFNEVSERVKEKNKYDVYRLVKLNEKLNVIDYFDKIRIRSKTLWEDLPQEGMKPKIRSKNSRIVDQVVWQVAREDNVILPNCPKKHEDDEEYLDDIDKKQGAIRNVLKNGALFDIGVVDLTSAYPTAIKDLCLSAENIVNESEYKNQSDIVKIDITDREDFNKIVKSVYFKQNPNAIIPKAIRNLSSLKDNLKLELSKLSSGDSNYKNTQIEYDAVKGILNSCFLPDTEIITTDGIKNIKEVKIGDKVINVNPNTLETEIDEIIDTQEYDYNGDCYSIFGSYVDVTYDHKFMVKRYNEVTFQSAETLYNERGFFIPKLQSGFTFKLDSNEYNYNIKMDKSNITKKYYNGKVYCVTTKKNHTVYAGRNGAFIICGQCFGVLGEKHFRFYNLDAFNATTSIVRNELFFGMNKIKEKGYEIVSYDTDSIFYKSTEDLSKFLDSQMKEFGKQYGVDITVKWDFEGYFSKVFISSNCRYYGYLVKNGVEESKPKIKGLEIKRSSSSKYEKYFQQELLEKILNKENIYDIIEWIWAEKKRITKLDLKEISFPVKISEREYTVDTIALRSLRNSKMLKPEFNIERGDLFYYIPIVPIGRDKDGKAVDVLAFKDNFNFNLNVDYKEVIEKSILKKSETIIENIDKSLIPALYRRII